MLPGDEYEKWFHEEQTQITRERKQNMLAQSRQAQGGANDVLLKIDFLIGLIER